MSTDTKMQSMDAAFFGEYTSHDAILKYTRATAGFGISHLLDHDYKDIYWQALEGLPALPAWARNSHSRVRLRRRHEPRPLHVDSEAERNRA